MAGRPQQGQGRGWGQRDEMIHMIQAQNTLKRRFPLEPSLTHSVSDMKCTLSLAKVLQQTQKQSLFVHLLLDLTKGQSVGTPV